VALLWCFEKLLNTQYSVILFVGVAGGLCVNLVLRNNKQGFPVHLHIRIGCPAMAEISKNANKLFHNHWPKRESIFFRAVTENNSIAFTYFA
jgi:hypothetical protein